MKYTPYLKPFQTPEQIANKLISDGLIIDDINFAINILSKINYFRFKIYLRPFLNLETKKFKPNTTFEKAYAIYCFDEELRNLLFMQISQIEIILRTILDQEISKFTNNPFWYLDNDLFDNYIKIDSIRTTLRNEFQRSKDQYALHYKNKYYNQEHNDFKDMPPFWIISELATFGNILSITNNLKKSLFKQEYNHNILDSLSKKFGAKNLKELNSWLHLIRDVRNRVAHHSRVWNCNYREPSGIKSKLDDEYQPTKSNKIYLLFVILDILYKNDILIDDIKLSICKLIDKYPTIVEYLASMGIPKKWIEDE